MGKSLESRGMVVPLLALNKQQVEEAIGVSVRKIDDLMARGEIPFARIDGRIVFPVSELRRWLVQKSRQENGGDSA